MRPGPWAGGGKEKEIEKIKKNIDNLEAFTVKGLKNKLNDDNKRS